MKLHSIEAEIMRHMVRAGLAPNQAAMAAAIASGVISRHRDHLIVSAARVGMSTRKISRLMGVSKSLVSLVLSNRSNSDWTAAERTVRAPDTE